MTRYDFLSVSRLLRHDKPCCNLYRHAAGHYDSSSLSFHLMLDASVFKLCFLVWQILYSFGQVQNYFIAKFEMAAITMNIEEFNVLKQCNPFNVS